MASQIAVQVLGLDFPLSSSLMLMFTFQDQSQVIPVTVTQYPQTKTITFSCAAISGYDQLFLKIKSGSEQIAWNESTIQTLLEPGSSETERWVDVYPMQSSPERKRRFLSFGNKASYPAGAEKPKRLGRIRLRISIIRGEVVSSSMLDAPMKARSRGETPSKTVEPRRAETPTQDRHEAVPEPATRLHLGSRSSELSDDQIGSSFKIELQSAIEAQANENPFLGEEKTDLSGCRKCARLSQIAMSQEDQINEKVGNLWMRHSNMLGKLRDSQGEALEVSTRFALGHIDPTIPVPVPLPGGELNRTESESYQKILQSLNSQLKMMQLAEHEDELLRDRIQQSVSSHSELESSLKETQSQMGKLEEKQRMVARDLEQDQAEIKRKTQIVDRNIKKKNQDIFELNEDLAQLQAEQDVRNKSADNYQALVQTLEKLYSQFSTTVQQRVELEQEYDSLQKAKVQEIETQFQTMGSERAGKVELQMTVAKLQAELSLARAKKEALEQESAVLKERLTKLKSDEALCIDDNHIWKSKQHVASTLEEVGHRSADGIETAKTEFQGAVTLVHNLNEVLTQRTHQTSDLLDEAKNNLALKVHRLEGSAIYRTRTRN